MADDTHITRVGTAGGPLRNDRATTMPGALVGALRLAPEPFWGIAAQAHATDHRTVPTYGFERSVGRVKKGGDEMLYDLDA